MLFSLRLSSVAIFPLCNFSAWWHCMSKLLLGVSEGKESKSTVGILGVMPSVMLWHHGNHEMSFQKPSKSQCKSFSVERSYLLWFDMTWWYNCDKYRVFVILFFLRTSGCHLTVFGESCYATVRGCGASVKVISDEPCDSNHPPSSLSSHPHHQATPGQEELCVA